MYPLYQRGPRFARGDFLRHPESLRIHYMNDTRTGYYIGIDLGTTGCRAIAIDKNGLSRATCAVALPEPVRTMSACELAPQLWWDAVCKVLTGIIDQIPAQEIRAIAVDGTSGSDGERLPSVVTASARNLPLLTCTRKVGIVVSII